MQYEIICSGGKATVSERMVVAAILEFHGGGLNASETAKAMEDYNTLCTTGSVTIEYIKRELSHTSATIKKVGNEDSNAGTD